MKKHFLLLLVACSILMSCNSTSDSIINVESLTLSKTSTTLSIGSNETITTTITPDNVTVKDLVWTSSDSKIVTVSQEGMLTGINSGNAVVTATTKDGNISASCSVVVNIKILFLGNSITKHGPAPYLGWYGNWGMAATSEDKDYVHVLINQLKLIHQNIDFKVENIASWERNFQYDLSSFTEINNYQPNILIIRLGENVDETYAKANKYQENLEKLIIYYKNTNTDIYITNCFWQNTFKDNVQKTVALVNNYNFVDIGSLSTDDLDHAFIDFENAGVANHPSDYGMHNIAQILYYSIQNGKYF